MPVSRGELIEIGGSFRLPDIIERSGCSIREVGTTNRTHLRDFEHAIDETSALLLKVHPSNYRIVGFTSNVQTPRPREARARHEDSRWWSTSAAARWSISNASVCRTNRPCAETLMEGADVVTFSGDKLLGSVQAGLIVGRRDLIERIKRNPLKRALRCDKITLAILHYTLRLYQDPERLVRELPLLATLTRPLDRLDACAQRIATILAARLRVRILRCRLRKRMPDRQRCIAGRDTCRASRFQSRHRRTRRSPDSRRGCVNSARR